MSIIRPRLNDYHKLPFTQEEVEFAIPFLTEDIPLVVDPFLLWKSPSLQDNSLHTVVTNCFNHLGYLTKKGREEEAVRILIKASECDEVGLGDSAKRKGKPIGRKTATEILSLFRDIPQLSNVGFVHFEEIQLYVDQVARDRISDLTCSFVKSFLVDYTIQKCQEYGIPREDCVLDIYDYKDHKFKHESVAIPVSPEKKDPILLVPKRWLRFMPWISYDDYFDNYLKNEALISGDRANDRIAILDFNRQNYDTVQAYVKRKEAQQTDCRNDPLFKAIPVVSAKRHMGAISKLPTGNDHNADKEYEKHICLLMASFFYPELDFAEAQSRTDSGVLIRDVIFYNNRSHEFLKDLYDQYDCRQIVMEIKNVRELAREHVNQINRYLKDDFGRFGAIITRNAPPRNIFKNTVDLWSGQRRCLLVLDDSDLSMMCQLFESKQRAPIDVLKKKYVEFMRACPG